jgi:deoxyribonuclease-4
MLIGAHVSSTGGIHTALDRAAEMKAEAVQIFTQSPRMWRPTAHPEENLDRFCERRAKLGVPVVCHALYLINLAAPDDAVYEKSVTALRHTVDVACRIDAEAVIFHVGSHLGAGLDAGLARVVPALQSCLERCTDTTWLLMENTAGAGGTIGRSLDELEVLFDRLDAHPRLGLCLDSCHLYASGYDVTDRAELDRVLDEADTRFGLDRLRALHVNDSQAPLGSNRDRHANIGEGLMGQGLGTFLAHPRLQGLPALLETPGKDNSGPDKAQLTRTRTLRTRHLNKQTA